MRSAEDGLIGLELFQSEAPDVIFVDYRMPKMNGVKVVSSIRSENTKIPIIFCSADRYLNSLELPADNLKIVKKPFDLKELLNLIETM